MMPRGVWTEILRPGTDLRIEQMNYRRDLERGDKKVLLRSIGSLQIFAVDARIMKDIRRSIVTYVR